MGADGRPLVDDRAIATRPLGFVQRGVGALHHRLHVARRDGRMDPGARLRGGEPRIAVTGEPAPHALCEALSLRVSAPGSRTTNSSPPKRATTSMSRASEASIRAVLISTRSPTSCPHSSLTRLKWSRSKAAIAMHRSSRRARGSSSDARSSKPRRLSRPVRASVRASLCRVSSMSSLWRTKISTTTATTRDRDHHVQPAPREAACRRERQQDHRVGNTDAGDDRRRAAPPEEEGAPEHGPHVEHGAVPRAGRGGSGRGRSVPRRSGRAATAPTGAGADRTPPAARRSPPRRGQARSRSSGRPGEPLDRSVEGCAAVHRRGRVGHQPFVHA